MLAEMINSQNNFKYYFYDFTQLSPKLNFYMDDSWHYLQLFILNIRLELICYIPSCRSLTVYFCGSFLALGCIWFFDDVKLRIFLVSWSLAWMLFCHCGRSCSFIVRVKSTFFFNETLVKPDSYYIIKPAIMLTELSYIEAFVEKNIPNMTISLKFK